MNGALRLHLLGSGRISGASEVGLHSLVRPGYSASSIVRMMYTLSRSASTSIRSAGRDQWTGSPPTPTSTQAVHRGVLTAHVAAHSPIDRFPLVRPGVGAGNDSTDGDTPFWSR